MCITSMVYDYYQPLIPQQMPRYWPPIDNNDSALVEELRQLIREFREAVAAAQTVDRLTDQPDCIDPAKKSLEERVARLEEMLAAQQGAP